MQIFDNFTVVAAPFPYTERPVSKRRPCVVVGQPHSTEMVWVLMITSAKNKRWKGDVSIKDLSAAGLSTGSVVRTSKIATVEKSVLRVIGKLDESAATSTRDEIDKHLRSGV